MDRAGNARTRAWVARVVAWHNRHPLARRITPAQVQGLGYVDLPYSAHDARTRRQWRAVFSDNFLPPLRQKQIARWSLRHGLDQTPDDAGQPVRQVPIDRSLLPPDGLALVLWVGTAAIHAREGRQTRVLLGPAAPHPVLGRRLWSRPRLAGAALSLLLLTSLPALQLLRHNAPPIEDEAPVLVQNMPAAVAAALAAASAAAAATPAAAVAQLPATPPPAPRSTGPFPPRRPLLDEASKIVAQQDLAAARAARAAAKGQTVYAVATKQVRTRAESELLGATLQAALVNTEAPRGLRVEALPAGGDWRAVCWPFLNRDDAERVREQLALRGQRIEVIAF